MDKLPTSQMIMCAKVNFENVLRLNPALRQHPIFDLAMQQLDMAIEQAEQEEAE